MTDLAGVERELAELWRQAAEEDSAVVRACMLNLVVCCEPGEDAADVSLAVARLSEQFPCRALVVTRTEDAAEGLRAHVSSHCHRGPGGRQVCSEQIALEVAPEGHDLVPASLLRLLVGDCPTYTWWRVRRLTADPLLSPVIRLSDRFVVDSAGCEDPPGALASLAGIAGDTEWPGHVGDVSWERLEPWREHVASLFDAPSTRVYLPYVSAARIVVAEASATPRARVYGAYLLGWLASRLGWTPPKSGPEWTRRDGAAVQVELTESDEPAVQGVAALTLHCEKDGVRAVFRVGFERDTAVRLSVEVDHACPLPFVRKVESRDEVTLLLDLLRRRSCDPVFLDTLGAVAAIG